MSFWGELDIRLTSVLGDGGSACPISEEGIIAFVYRYCVEILGRCSLCTLYPLSGSFSNAPVWLYCNVFLSFYVARYLFGCPVAFPRNNSIWGIRFYLNISRSSSMVLQTLLPLWHWCTNYGAQQEDSR